MADGCQLFVNRLPLRVDEEELSDFLNLSATTGRVVSIELRRYANGFSSSNALVRMTTRSAVDEIVEAAPHFFNGALLNINYDLKQAQRRTDSNFGVGLMINDNRIKVEMEEPINIYLSPQQAVDARFSVGERVCVKWKWFAESRRHEALVVSKMEEHIATLVRVQDTCGYLIADCGLQIFFFYEAVCPILNTEADKWLQIGDTLKCICRVQPNRSPRLHALKITIPSMIVAGNSGNTVRFGILIELSFDQTQGILYSVPLGKVLIEKMANVANVFDDGREEGSWTIYDRIVFEERKLNETRHGCEYIAENAYRDANVRIPNQKQQVVETTKKNNLSEPINSACSTAYDDSNLKRDLHLNKHKDEAEREGPEKNASDVSTGSSLEDQLAMLMMNNTDGEDWNKSAENNDTEADSIPKQSVDEKAVQTERLEVLKTIMNDDDVLEVIARKHPHLLKDLLVLTEKL